MPNTDGLVRRSTGTDLRRALSRYQVLAIVVGTGIYIRPASIAQLVGSQAAILGVWLAAGLGRLCGALTYSQLAMRHSGSGGRFYGIPE